MPQSSRGGKKERAQDSLSASRTRLHICNEGFHKNDLAKRAEKPLNPNAFVSQRGKKKHPTGLYQILSDVMAGAEGLFLLARRSSVRAALTCQRACHSLPPPSSPSSP